MLQVHVIGNSTSFPTDFSESLCEGKVPGSKVGHPYKTELYIACGVDPVIVVESCDQGLLFNSSSAKCYDPYAAGKYVTMR